MTEDETLTFEKALEELETIVNKLEQEDVPLEKAIDFYQKGMHLSKICNEKLLSAEKKMTQIMKDEDESEPFNVQGD